MRTIYVDKIIPRMLAVKVLRSFWPNVIWSTISHAKITDIPEPILPGSKWLRVSNRQCGICATDLALLNVEVDPAVSPAALPGNKRFYLGHEVVGEVVEIGSEVTRFEVGDRVVMESRFAGPNCHTQEIDPLCGFCAHGQVRLCENASLGQGPSGVGGGWGDGFTAHEDELWLVPDELDDDQASLIEPTAVALHSVLRHPPNPGDHVLVYGAGIIGLLTTQMARRIEPEIHLTVLARYPHQVDAASRFEADEVVMGGDLYAEMARITGAKMYKAPLNRGMLLGGFDVIYDCVGEADTLGDSLRWARAGGTVVMVGVSLSALKIDLNPVWYQEVDLIGSHTFGYEMWRGREVHSYDLVIEMTKAGEVNHEGLITHRFPFEDYKEAIATAMDKCRNSIKVILEY